ncbi:hypothetical protein [Pleomorphomonas koreensis]|uniref:hypothetical protein n=1 Tax=Pleomorphomonas koreensis TaxID=257440 RepID=UPI00041E0FBD|nr:hypothetical protein [Pleomorphomonas koreensis]
MPDLTIIKDSADIATPIIFGLATLYFAWKAFVYDREQIQAAREADICSWSEKCLKALCSAEGLCELSDQMLDEMGWLNRKSEVLGELSALVDYGRLYFPNVVDGRFGLHKEVAYQGVRQPILDHLVDAHRIVLRSRFRSGEGHQQRKSIVEQRRAFISRVYEQINPHRRLGFLKREAVLKDSN